MGSKGKAGASIALRQTALALLALLLAGGASLARSGEASCPGRPRPAAVAPQRAALLGEYVSPAGEAVRFREGDSGRLELLVEGRSSLPSLPAGAYALEERGPSAYAVPAAKGRPAVRVTFARESDQGISPAASCTIGDRLFVRRLTDAERGKPFRIVPQRPLDELRREAATAVPPRQDADFAAPDWVDAARAVPDVHLDIRYATDDNFTGEAFYPSARAFLQRPAAAALARAAGRLKPLGYGIVIHDAYRPWTVTKMFWDATPESQKAFVANPAQGSRHNRGTAVDVSLYALSSGKPVPMPSGYDEFTPRAFADYPGGCALDRWHRDLLRCVMESEGFLVYSEEWWHYDFQCPKPYPISNESFETLDRNSVGRTGNQAR